MLPGVSETMGSQHATPVSEGRGFKRGMTNFAKKGVLNYCIFYKMRTVLLTFLVTVISVISAIKVNSIKKIAAQTDKGSKNLAEIRADLEKQYNVAPEDIVTW